MHPCLLPEILMSLLKTPQPPVVVGFPQAAGLRGRSSDAAGRGLARPARRRAMGRGDGRITGHGFRQRGALTGTLQRTHSRQTRR
jgi:hypothetical protein